MEKSKDYEKDILRRIGEFYRTFNNSKLDNEEFYKQWGASKEQLENMIKSSVSFNFSTLESILMLHPELSTEWLFRGEGERLKPKQEVVEEDQKLDCLRNMSKHLESIDESISRFIDKGKINHEKE